MRISDWSSDVCSSDLHSTSGGLSDTELKLLAVRPTGVPSTVRAVMMVTPVAKVPSALRNSVGSNAWAVIALPVRTRFEKTPARRRRPTAQARPNTMVLGNKRQEREIGRAHV